MILHFTSIVIFPPFSYQLWKVVIFKAQIHSRFIGFWRWRKTKQVCFLSHDKFHQIVIWWQVKSRSQSVRADALRKETMFCRTQEGCADTLTQYTIKTKITYHMFDVVCLQLRSSCQICELIAKFGLYVCRLTLNFYNKAPFFTFKFY